MIKSKTILALIVLIGLFSNIFPQETFRKAIFLARSVGTSIYEIDGATTSVPIECHKYNLENNYIGEDSVFIYRETFPYGGNAWYRWHAIFDDDDSLGNDIYQYIEDYDIIIIKTCYTAGVPVYWYEGPQDTILYPNDLSYYCHQWHLRPIINIMGNHPDKFFVIWTLPMYTPTVAPNGYPLGDAFSYWMKDTLAAGLDPIYNSRYGDFPENVYIYDYFHDIDSLTWMPYQYAVAPDDNHPNAAASSLIAPLFVKAVFDAAIQYETGILTGTGESTLKSNDYILNQNYPNPFNPTTEINFSLAKSGNISLMIYDISGSVVDTLVEGYMNEGKHSVIFNAEGLNSGVYFYRLKTDNFTSTRKMILIK